MTGTTFERARIFMHRNARPLDLARFEYHFEGGSKNDVMDALSFYQNTDGGFAHAIEADCWNPNSTMLQASTAVEIIREIDWDDPSHPLIMGLLRWIESGEHFDGKTWALTVASNDDFPCAPWWRTQSVSSCHTDYNGTALLAGFIVRYATKGSAVFNLGVRIALEASDALFSSGVQDMHTLACYLRMASLFERSGCAHLIKFDELEAALEKSVCGVVERDVSKWGGYVCRPSSLIRSKKSRYYRAVRELADYECEFIRKSQREDGSWDVPWAWDGWPEQQAVSRNWWRGQIIIQNLLYLKGFDAL